MFSSASFRLFWYIARFRSKQNVRPEACVVIFIALKTCVVNIIDFFLILFRVSFVLRPETRAPKRAPRLEVRC